MWDLTRDTVSLVLRNRLFADPGVAYRQAGIGAIGTALLFITLVNLQLPLWLAGTVAGLAGGYAMPYLFKDIKFT